MTTPIPPTPHPSHMSDQYRVIAHKHPDAAHAPPDRPVHAPALVADQHGRLALVHEGQTQFRPMDEGAQREAIQQVLTHPDKWRRYAGKEQPAWRPGAHVTVQPDGTSYVEDASQDAPQESTPDDVPPRRRSAADTDHAATAPRQAGEPYSLVGRASVAGVTAGYSLPMTGCHTCVNFNRDVLGIKPCRLPVEQITNRDVDFYSSQGGCPYWEFGQHTTSAEESDSFQTEANTPKSTGKVTDAPPEEPTGGDTVDMGKAEPAQSAEPAQAPAQAQMAEPQTGGAPALKPDDDGNPDTPAPEDPFEDHMALRGALIALLGGRVVGRQAAGVALVGQPRHVPGLDAEAPAGDDEAPGGGDDEDEDAQDHTEEGETMQSGVAVPMSEAAAHVDEGDDDAVNAWLDGQRAQNADAGVEAALDDLDTLGEERTGLARLILAEMRQRGLTFASAVRAVTPAIQSSKGGE